MKKIDVKNSTIYRRDRREDLSKCVFLLGGQGYFSDDDDFSTYEYGTLAELRCWMPLSNHPFVKRNNGEGMWYKYFIPEESVTFEEVEEPKEKKYRPYKYVCELPFKVGDVITIKAKDSDENFEALINEISYDEHIINHISIGSRDWCDTPFLFDSFEILVNDEWVPFGVEENEED